MKRLRERFKSISPIFQDLNLFVVALTKKLLFRLTLLVTFIDLIDYYLIPEFRLNRIYYLGFAVIGFVWSTFEVYRDLLLTYRKSVPEVKVLTSKLSVSFVEGNEYAFSLDHPYKGEIQEFRMEKIRRDNTIKTHFDENEVFFVSDKAYYELPEGWLAINIRLENIGDFPIDILAINSNNSLNMTDGMGMHTEDVLISNNSVLYPLHIEMGEIRILKVKYSISTNLFSNTAQFAASFRSLPKSIWHEVSFDTIDLKGKKQLYKIKAETFLRPLIDLYVNQWRRYYQSDYLRLAGYEQ